MTNMRNKTLGVRFAGVFLVTLAVSLEGSASGRAQEGQEQDQGIASVPVETFELSNGMKFLAVRRPELTTVSAGWVAHVGSSNERPGITGISHFFEHMMFKGTHVVGTRDIERDLAIVEEQEAIQEQIRALQRLQRERFRLGEIDDPFDTTQAPPELNDLRARFDALLGEQRELMVKDEFDKLYTEQGASGMNAFTSHDVTVYFITVPANKLELWFWMESDRLLNPVFREFYSERDVVHEERRLRTESTPTGEFDELFDAMFWQSHPYSWPVVGWPSDLRSYTLAQAKSYYDTYYAPNNLTAALVGNFELSEAKELAERYFGRLAPSPTAAPDVVTLEMEQKAEKRMVAECDCQPQVEIRYHTPPFRHRDSYALEVLSGLLNGRSGRLYTSLVLDEEIASDAGAFQDSRKWAGSFSLQAEAKGDATPEQLERRLHEELQRIQEEPITERELQKVKNQITASSYRRLSSGFFLLIQLLVYDGLGDWQYINEWAERTLSVTADDVKRVAKEYFGPENRSVALYYRKEGTEATTLPTELEGLPPQVQQQIMGQLEQIRSSESVEELQALLSQVATQQAQAPPPLQKVFPLIERTIRERLAELEGGEE
jgi:predicted Zn-dependent peptidase